MYKRQIVERLYNDSQYDHLTANVVTSIGAAVVTDSNLPNSVPVLHKPIPVEELKELVLQAVKD